jgi:hypothetical protein
LTAPLDPVVKHPTFAGVFGQVPPNVGVRGVTLGRFGETGESSSNPLVNNRLVLEERPVRQRRILFEVGVFECLREQIMRGSEDDPVEFGIASEVADKAAVEDPFDEFISARD